MEEYSYTSTHPLGHTGPVLRITLPLPLYAPVPDTLGTHIEYPLKKERTLEMLITCTAVECQYLTVKR